MTTTSCYEIKSAKSGKTIRFEATYACELRGEIVDGHRVRSEPEVTTAGSGLTVYIDGKWADWCAVPGGWALTDVKGHSGCKKISGLNIVFTDAAQAEAYETWIGGVIEAGKPEDVRRFEADKRAAKLAEEMAAAERIIKRAEAQTDIPTRAEAQRRMKAYNDVNNEGGEGYVPHIISREEYERAVSFLAANA